MLEYVGYAVMGLVYGIGESVYEVHRKTRLMELQKMYKAKKEAEDRG